MFVRASVDQWERDVLEEGKLICFSLHPISINSNLKMTTTQRLLGNATNRLILTTQVGQGQFKLLSYTWRHYITAMASALLEFSNKLHS